MRLLLADDHHLVRDALVNFIRLKAPDLTVAEAASLGEALRRIEREPPFDAIVLDLHMPGMNGLAGLGAARLRAPGVPVVILSGDIPPEQAADALERGAAGVIPKDLRGGALLSALRLVLAGEVFAPASLLGPAARSRACADAATDDAARTALGGLTPRELDAVRWLVRGLSNRDIAARLNVTEATIKLHLHNAFRKMGVHSRTDAVRMALDVLRGG